ncbi:hypothetical protein DV515_00012951 [Chloebia gouldiae]|uniref:Uncharacterized protein n=1 Tax=Chloebia gouldiae TaxID=44316 RepID=A0A3L8S3G9_CHLGU|nr:hypothetical protein DV515_00012951 [Chloebia gouldiae]
MDWLETVGNSDSLRTQTSVMRPLCINRADPGCLLHSELSSPWDNAALSLDIPSPEGGADSGSPRGIYSSWNWLQKGFQRQQPNSELGKGEIPGGWL